MLDESTRKNRIKSMAYPTFLDLEDLRRRAQSAIGVTHRTHADVEALMHVYNFS